ncbi:MAG TPA: Rieske 2Fe-2S domain-containing protein [Chthonomonadaceae bacterium]|nr:Rieske 2Fe-2S domain-containing protein [Chthonomonadaceae bacterium]
MRKARYAVARTGDLALDRGTIVPLGAGGECALFCHNGRWHATGSLCPHQNAPLQDAAVECGEIVCARHGYRFDLRTGNCSTLGGYGLPVYPVEVEGDTVYVSVWEFD